MIATRNGLTTCTARSDVEGQRWDAEREGFWGKNKFGLHNIILCTDDSSVWIAAQGGLWREWTA